MRRRAGELQEGILPKEGEPKSYMEELIEDFIAIITSFASRIYGKRSQKFRKLKKCVEEAMR